MDKPTVSIETSIVSYLAADPSRHPVTAHNQRLTHDWWNTRRQDYALFTSPLTWMECTRGDPEMVRRRLELLATMPARSWPSGVMHLAWILRSRIPLHEGARADAQHIALAAMNRSAYLLTWDRKHIANPRLMPRIATVLRAHGYSSPVLCTPVELMEVN